MEILKASETAKHLGGMLEAIEIMHGRKLMKDLDAASKDIKESKPLSLNKVLRELKH